MISKYLTAPIFVLILLLSLNSIGQPPVLEVKSFEYIWTRGDDAMKAIALLDDSAKYYI
jgi:hypothetical protein